MTDSELKGLAGRVGAIIEERKDAFVAFAASLLRFETVSGDESEEGRERYRREVARCFEAIGKEAGRLGMAFRVYEGRAAVAELKGSERVGPVGPVRLAGPGAQPIGVALHIDVVPGGDGWTYPAFSGTVTNDALWGRGAQDNKGPIGAAFAAIETLVAAGVRPARSIRLLFGTQEETGAWDDVDLLIARGEAPGPVIVPDGAFPIINGEKGMINIELKAAWEPVAPVAPGGADAAPAPSAPAVRFISLQSGRRANMVPDLATLRLGARAQDAGEVSRQLNAAAERQLKKTFEANVDIDTDDKAVESKEIVFTLAFHGRSAHGAHPDAGHNAALDALEYLLLLTGEPEWNGRLETMMAFIRFLHERARLLDASGFGLALHHDHLKDTTANLGILEMDEGGGRAEINIRYPLGLTPTEIALRFQRLARELSAEASGLRVHHRVVGKAYEPLFVAPERHGAFLSALQRAYQTATGREPRLSSIAGTTYAKAYPLAVAFGPVDESAGEVEMAHKSDERVAIARYLENIKIYALALALLTEND